MIEWIAVVDFMLRLAAGVFILGVTIGACFCLSAALHARKRKQETRKRAEAQSKRYCSNCKRDVQSRLETAIHEPETSPIELRIWRECPYCRNKLGATDLWIACEEQPPIEPSG